MLERDGGPTKTHAFLISIVIQDDVDMGDVMFKLSDAVSWYEGCGTCEVEYLGELTEYEKEPNEN